MVQPMQTKFILQPAKVDVMYTACLEYACPPPNLTFFVSVKPFCIAPTDGQSQMTLKGVISG